MAPQKKRTPAQVRERRSKIAAAVLGVVFLGVAAIQGPKLLKQLHPSAQAAADSAPPPASVGGTVALVAASLAPGQLRHFSTFAAKDPFKAQVASASTAAGGGGAASATTKANGPTGASGPAATFTETTSGASSPPARTVPAALILYNGKRQVVALGTGFPEEAADVPARVSGIEERANRPDRRLVRQRQDDACACPEPEGDAGRLDERRHVRAAFAPADDRTGIRPQLGPARAARRRRRRRPPPATADEFVSLSDRGRRVDRRCVWRMFRRLAQDEQGVALVLALDLDARPLLVERFSVALERGESPVVVQLGERDARLRAGRGRTGRRGGGAQARRSRAAAHSNGVPASSFSQDGGTVSYAGTLSGSTWTMTGTGTINGTTRKVSAQATVGASQTIPDPSIWNYLYTDNKTSCFTLQGGSTVAVPLYTQGPRSASRVGRTSPARISRSAAASRSAVARTSGRARRRSRSSRSPARARS